MNQTFWQGKRIFLTGHTGFKGGWLALWLARMGAKVYGYSLDPPTTPSLFNLTGIQEEIAEHRIGDIRDYKDLSDALLNCRPEIVFHLAAQPLVRSSYHEPLATLDTNVMGTANLLEAIRNLGGVRSVVVITSDKCYQNNEWPWPYRENEPLGGHDPYSASKACTELVVAAYRSSFFVPGKGCAIATARAGNVIGGGDFAGDRLLPDLFRAHTKNEPVCLRSPEAIRPWQHVLEPLRGYLLLAEKLHTHGNKYADAWNFGPWEKDARNVQWIVEYMADRLPGFTWTLEQQPQPHEAGTLQLDSNKARKLLHWQPVWSLEQALDRTLSWHLGLLHDKTSLLSLTRDQIADYETAAWQN